MGQLTLEDLIDIMRECAGEDEEVNLDGDILDQPFFDLGYDSLALLQTTGRIERQYDIVLDEDGIVEAETPRALLDLVNGTLTHLVA